MTQRLTNHFSTNARVVSTMSIYLYSYPFKLIRVWHFPKFILLFDDDDDITGNILEVFKLNIYSTSGFYMYYKFQNFVY